MQLPETWNVLAGALSHGMAKRVSMAQALMGSPPVIFLDEPTAGLDPKIAASVRGLIRDLKGTAHRGGLQPQPRRSWRSCATPRAILDKGKLVSAASMAEMTGLAGEFRVQVSRGEVPLPEVRALAGVREAKLEAQGVLVVHYDGAVVQPEEIITRTAALLAQTRRVLHRDVAGPEAGAAGAPADLSVTGAGPRQAA